MNKLRPIHYGLLYFMKISLLQLAISFLTAAMAFAVDTNGQEVLEKKVSIRAENSELQDVLFIASAVRTADQVTYTAYRVT